MAENEKEKPENTAPETVKMNASDFGDPENTEFSSDAGRDQATHTTPATNAESIVAGPDLQALQTDQLKGAEFGRMGGVMANNSDGADHDTPEKRERRKAEAQATLALAQQQQAAQIAAIDEQLEDFFADIDSPEAKLKNDLVLAKSHEAVDRLDTATSETISCQTDREAELQAAFEELEKRQASGASAEELAALEAKIDQMTDNLFEQDEFVKTTEEYTTGIKEAQAELEAQQESLTQQIAELQAQRDALEPNGDEETANKIKAMEAQLEELKTQQQDITTAQQDLQEKAENVENVAHLAEVNNAVYADPEASLNEKVRTTTSATIFAKAGIGQQDMEGNAAVPHETTAQRAEFEAEYARDKAETGSVLSMVEDQAEMAALQQKVDNTTTTTEDTTAPPTLKMDETVMEASQRVVSLAEGGQLSATELDAALDDMDLSPEERARVEESLARSGIDVVQPEDPGMTVTMTGNDATMEVAQSAPAPSTPQQASAFGFIQFKRDPIEVTTPDKATQRTNGIATTTYASFADSAEFAATNPKGETPSYATPVNNNEAAANALTVANAYDKSATGQGTGDSGGGAGHDQENLLQKLAMQHAEQRNAMQNQQMNIDPNGLEEGPGPRAV
ncbi:MAG: hypothetical protein ACLFP8_01055 [Alphaproteobacteria bacterium]